MSKLLNSLLNTQKVATYSVPVMHIVDDLGVPNPAASAVFIHEIMARTGKNGGQPVEFTPVEALQLMRVEERTFRRITAALRKGGLLKTTRRLKEGGGNIALYAVNENTLKKMLGGLL